MSEVEGYELGPELKRKSFEALNHLLNQVHKAQITEEQFNTGVDVLFMAVSGLIPEKPAPTTALGIAAEDLRAIVEARGPRFIDVITQCQNEIQNVFPVIKRVLFNPESGMFKVFRWQAGDSFVDCTTCVPGKAPEVNRIQNKDAAEARHKMENLSDNSTLHKFGYREVSA